MFLMPVAFAQSKTLLTKMVSFFNFNEGGTGDAIDAIGANNLTQVNSPGSTTGLIRDCRAYSAGSNQYFTNASSTILGPATLDSFCFAGWIYPGAFSGVTQFVVLTKDGGASGIGVRLFNRQVAGVNTLSWGVGNGVSEALINFSSGGYVANAWYWYYAYCDAVAAEIGLRVRDAANTFNTLTGPTAMGFTPADGVLGEFTFGSYAGSHASPLTGRTDATGCWNRLLTDKEQTDLYNSGAGKEYPF